MIIDTLTYVLIAVVIAVTATVIHLTRSKS